jgi:hypothetical protein
MDNETQKIVKAAQAAQAAGIETAQAATLKGKVAQATATEAQAAVKHIGGGVVEGVFIGSEKSRIYYTQKAVIMAFAAAYGVKESAVSDAVKQLWNTPTLPYLWAAAREAATPEQLISLTAKPGKAAKKATESATEAGQAEA